MTDLTPRLKLPSPTLGEGADAPAAIRALAMALDAVTPYGQGLAAARPVSTPGSPGVQGRFYRPTDQPGIIYYDNGVGWDTIGLVAHADNHKIGGSDPLSPSDIGAVGLSMLVALGG